MGVTPSPERWLLLAKEFQKHLDSTKPWIVIDLSSYNGTKNLLKYYCEKHDYNGTCSGAALKKSKGCPECQKELHSYRSPEYQESRRLVEAEKFITKAQEVHGEKYKYHIDWYEARNDTLTKIWCNTHQEFFYQRPAAHVQGQGCPKCGKDSFKINARYSQEEFFALVDAVNQNPNLDFSNSIYTHMHEKLDFFCKIHGLKSISAGSLVRNPQSCTQCNRDRCRNDSENNFAKFGSIIHDNQYDYSLITGKYKSNRTKLPVICRVHNTISYISANHHIDRRQGGCKDCAKLKFGRWNIKTLSKNFSYHYNKPFCVYLIKISREEEYFYKVGITSNIIKRVRQLNEELQSYVVEVLIQNWSNTVECVLLEKYILSEYKESKYIPPYEFGGYTECLLLRDEEILAICSILSAPA